MFEKDQFVEYVGAASGSSYASGLSNIERLYSVDIDGEYEKDSCKELLSQLDELKRETGITQAELSNRQNRYSNLKKYVEFRNGGKVRIVDQYRQCFKNAATNFGGLRTMNTIMKKALFSTNKHEPSRMLGIS